MPYYLTSDEPDLTDLWGRRCSSVSVLRDSVIQPLPEAVPFQERWYVLRLTDGTLVAVKASEYVWRWFSAGPPTRGA